MPIVTMSCCHACSYTAPATGNTATGHTVRSSAQPVLQWLMDKYQITTSQVNHNILQRDIPYLAACFDNAEFYVDALQLSPGEQIDVQRKESNHLAMIISLKIWKDKNPSQATFRVLLEMLIRLKKEEIVNEVCQYIKVSVCMCAIYL